MYSPPASQKNAFLFYRTMCAISMAKHLLLSTVSLVPEPKKIFKPPD